VNDFWLCDVVIVVPKKESCAVKTVVAVKPGVWRTYVTHLGLVGEGVNASNPGSEGGFPCLSHHGSWSRQIRFSVFLAKSCNAEIVVAWPLAQFSSCTDPTDASVAIYSATSAMGASPRLVVFVFVFVKLRNLIRSGQLGSLAL
jgi:hypothetical protein